MPKTCLRHDGGPSHFNTEVSEPRGWDTTVCPLICSPALHGLRACRCPMRVQFSRSPRCDSASTRRKTTGGAHPPLTGRSLLSVAAVRRLLGRQSRRRAGGGRPRAAGQPRRGALDSDRADRAAVSHSRTWQQTGPSSSAAPASCCCSPPSAAARSARCSSWRCISRPRSTWAWSARWRPRSSWRPVGCCSATA